MIKLFLEEKVIATGNLDKKEIIKKHEILEGQFLFIDDDNTRHEITYKKI